MNIKKINVQVHQVQNTEIKSEADVPANMEIKLKAVVRANMEIKLEAKVSGTGINWVQNNDY